MPSTAKSSSSKTTKKPAAKSASREPDAIKLLKQDHREVEAMFAQYEELKGEKQKLALSQKICLALKVHAQVEEELLYPAERGEVEDDMLDEALVEHAGAKNLIAEIEAMKPGDDLYDAKVKVLGEYIKHHVKEEENEMFPAAKKSDLDLDAIGAKIAARKAELMKQLGGRMN